MSILSPLEDLNCHKVNESNGQTTSILILGLAGCLQGQDPFAIDCSFCCLSIAINRESSVSLRDKIWYRKLLHYPLILIAMLETRSVFFYLDLRICPTPCQADIKTNLCIYTVFSEHKSNVLKSKQMNILDMMLSKIVPFFTSFTTHPQILHDGYLYQIESDLKT